MKPTATERLITVCQAIPLLPAERQTVETISHQYWNLNLNPSGAEVRFLKKLKKNYGEHASL